MKAVQMTSAGGPEVLRHVEIPRPEIRRKGEMLVRIAAAGLNPVDVKQRTRGTWYPSEPPVTLGIDGSGVVETTGEGVERFRPGDEVFFAYGGYGKEPGTYAEFAVVDERLAARKPGNISFAEAAAAPSSLVTAWECLFDLGRLAKGETVLVQAGAGGVGHLAVQLAREAGVRVAATVNGEEKARLVRSLGAERAIFYDTSDFVEETLEWTGGRGVDCAVDLVGGKTFFKTFSAVRFYGRVVTLLGPDPTLADWKDARMRNLTVSFYLMLTPMYYDLPDRIGRQAEILERCAKMLESGALRVHLAKTFPLREAAAAHRLLEAGDAIGKIALVNEGGEG